jgi:periplasmic copper chaperone A
MIRWVPGVLAAILIAVPASAQLEVISISNPWIRFVTPQTPAAGYFTITNAGAHPVVIVGASSPNCGSVMLHRSQSVSGTESMTPVSSVTVPAHGSVSFQPGGYHLMCMSPSGVTAGGHVPMTLHFQDNHQTTKDFLVRGVKSG